MYKPIVSVQQGKVRGVTVKGVLGPSYIAFYEIPYAAPPIKNLRFKDPKQSPPWMGIRDCSVCTGKICAQAIEQPPNNIIGNEDCLYLNVYTNSLTQSKPVMFWVHGGGFSNGTASYRLVKPDYLLTKDVVIVAANYRLGVFGFLNLGHRAAPGNQGLKDLIAALEWVKENIANFGGDPNNVTLFGQSAGAVLTHALTISPSARGLFHKAIMQSGNLLSSWGFGQSRPERSFKFAAHFEITSTNPEEVVEALRKLTDKEIAKAQLFLLTKEERITFAMAFGTNYDELAESPVLPMQIEQLCSNDVSIPIMTGYLSYDIAMFFNDDGEEAVESYNHHLSDHMSLIEALKKLGPTEREELLKTVKDQYFNGQPVERDTMDKFLNCLTDIYFGNPNKLYMLDRVKRTSTPSYFYRFSYFEQENTYADLLVKRLVKGASHMDELSYLFYQPPCKVSNPAPPAYGTKDRVVMERLTTMWTNFAKTGNPTPVHDDLIKTTWKPATKDELNYLEIGKESVSLISQVGGLGYK